MSKKNELWKLQSASITNFLKKLSVTGNPINFSTAFNAF